MSGRRLGTVLVVCLLLAGCLGQAGSTATPPGITTDGVVDTSALIESHTETLRSTSVTVRSTRTMRSSDPDFTMTTNQTWRLDGGTPVQGYSVRTFSAEGDAPEQYRAVPNRIAAYRNGSTTVERVTTANGSSTRRVDLLNSSVRVNTALYRSSINELTTRKNATVEPISRNGTTLYRVSATLEDTRLRSNASMTLFVTPAGVVRELRTERTVRYRSGPRRITKRVWVSDVGTTTVERPAWVPPAGNATTSPTANTTAQPAADTPRSENRS